MDIQIFESWADVITALMAVLPSIAASIVCLTLKSVFKKLAEKVESERDEDRNELEESRKILKESNNEILMCRSIIEEQKEEIKVYQSLVKKCVDRIDDGGK